LIDFVGQQVANIGLIVTVGEPQGDEVAALSEDLVGNFRGSLANHDEGEPDL
jgi:hypothetical protein